MNEITIAAMHSFKFTMFLHSKCLWYLLSFRDIYIYWMKSVIWRHLLEPNIFSIIVLLFYESTWSAPYVKETVSNSQHLLQPSILSQTVCATKCTKVPAITSLFVRECVNLQFHNSNCNYSLSAVNVLEE